MNQVEVRELDIREWGASWEQLTEDVERTRNDWLWFSSHKTSLRKSYLNKWIAVKSERVVMADTDHDELLRRLKARPEGRAGAEVFFVAPKGVDYIY